jgi:hypothetical protein
MAQEEAKMIGPEERQCPLCNKMFSVLLERVTPEDFASDGRHFITEQGVCSCGFEHKKAIAPK